VFWAIHENIVIVISIIGFCRNCRFYLPSHASHLLQPIDLSVNSTFAKKYDHDQSICAHERRESLLCATRRALSLALCNEGQRRDPPPAFVNPLTINNWTKKSSANENYIKRENWILILNNIVYLLI
jgi:hypothetical protein